MRFSRLLLVFVVAFMIARFFLGEGEVSMALVMAAVVTACVALFTRARSGALGSEAEKATEKVSEVYQDVAQEVSEKAEVISDKVDEVAKEVAEKASGASEKAVEAYHELAKDVSEGVSQASDKVVEASKKAMDASEAVTGVNVSHAYDKASEVCGDIAGKVSDTVGDASDKVVEGYKDLAQNASEGAAKVSEKVSAFSQRDDSAAKAKGGKKPTASTVNPWSQEGKVIWSGSRKAVVTYAGKALPLRILRILSITDNGGMEFWAQNTETKEWDTFSAEKVSNIKSGRGRQFSSFDEYVKVDMGIS